jgi:cell wall-associated NlpC family hydrolase
VFWATNPGNPSTIHHVAIYLGNGQMVEAPESGSVVKVSAMRWKGYAGAVRPSA